MLAGHGGDAVTWMDENYEHWQRRLFQAAARPGGSTLLAANPVDATATGTAGCRRSATDRGRRRGRNGAARLTAVFPHVLNGDNDKTPDRDFRGQWARPLRGRLCHRFAAAVAIAQLGRDDSTDFGIASTPDLVGHAFGPGSQEVQDIYAHLDGTIGACRPVRRAHRPRSCRGVDCRPRLPAAREERM